MTAGTIERPGSRTRSLPPSTRWRVAATDAPTGGRTAAAARAYARRGQRMAGQGDPLAGSAGPAAGRIPFVLLVMTLLVGGLVATLWLSTAATADSYRLAAAQQQTTSLSEQGQRLQREVAATAAAPALAAAARQLGMVPVDQVARLVVEPDGEITVVGTPTPARAPAPPPVQAGEQAQPPPPVQAAAGAG